MSTPARGRHLTGMPQSEFDALLAISDWAPFWEPDAVAVHAEIAAVAIEDALGEIRRSCPRSQRKREVMRIEIAAAVLAQSPNPRTPTFRTTERQSPSGERSPR